MGFRSSRQRESEQDSQTTSTVPRVSTSRPEDIKQKSSKTHATDTARDEDTGPIPKNIDLFNERSVHRSTAVAYDDSRTGDTGVPDTVRDVIASPGRSLDTSIQRAMEERIGDQLGDVRIHTGPAAAQACEDINARAFTVGNHVAFNTGEYDSESPEGQHVLAHELAHVRQQTGGAVSMLPDKGEFRIDPDERLEREAERTAERVMRGGALGVPGMRKADVHVQRMPADRSRSRCRHCSHLLPRLRRSQLINGHTEYN